jgi:hypothetical protein
MNLGDVIEKAIWLTGDESPELRKRYEQDVTQAIEDLCREHGFLHGPVTWVEKRPGEDRVPQVPDHVQGSRVRLLVAESIVTDYAPQTSEGSFIANLEKKDLERLRVITRRQSKTTLSDQDCDELIEQYGPEAVLETLRQHVGSTVH